MAVRRIALVGDALLVEGQHVGHHAPRRPAGRSPDRRLAGRQPASAGKSDARQPRLHGLQERGVRADPVGERGQAGPVRDRPRRQRLGALAAAAAAGRTPQEHVAQLIGHLASSSFSRPLLGKRGSLSQPGDLQRSRGEASRAISPCGPSSSRWKLSTSHALHARDGLRGGDQAREGDPLAEGQVVGMEEPRRPSGSSPVAENVQQRRLDVAAQVVRLHADAQLDVERHGDRRLHDHVVPDPAIAMESRPISRSSRRDVATPLQRVHRHQRLGPAPGPAQRRPRRAAPGPEVARRPGGRNRRR